jgi:photosystem II stability/assembly factor-like uncharacterized protein
MLSFRLLSQDYYWEKTKAVVPSNLISMTCDKSSRVYVGGFGGAIRSADRGETWTTISGGLGNPKAFCFGFKDNLIFCGTHGGVFVSNDDGNSWTPKNNGLGDTAWHINTMCVLPTGEILLGTLYKGIFRSNNNGDKWDTVKTRLINTAVNAFAVHPFTKEVYIATYSGVYKSNNLGDDWEKVVNGMGSNTNAYALAVSTEGTMFVGTRNGVVFRSLDGGANWVQVLNLQENMQIYSITINIKGEIFAGTYGRGVYYSNDNGLNWKEMNFGLYDRVIYAMASSLGGDVYAGTWESGVFRLADLLFTAEASGEYCVGDDITVTITVIPDLNTNNIFTIQLSDAEGSFENPTVLGTYKSKKSGSPKFKVPQVPDGRHYRIRAISSDPPDLTSKENSEDITILNYPKKPNITQQGDSLISSADCGNQWYFNNVKIEGAIFKILMPKDSGYYKVQCANGKCLSEFSDSIFFFIKDTSDTGHNYVDFSKYQRNILLYPNPTNQFVNINFDNLAQDILKIELIDNLGQVLFEDTKIQFFKDNQYKINVTAYPSGLYFLKVFTRKEVLNLKFIVSH